MTGRSGPDVRDDIKNKRTGWSDFEVINNLASLPSSPDAPMQDASETGASSGNSGEQPNLERPADEFREGERPIESSNTLEDECNGDMMEIAREFFQMGCDQRLANGSLIPVTMK